MGITTNHAFRGWPRHIGGNVLGMVAALMVWTLATAAEVVPMDDAKSPPKNTKAEKDVQVTLAVDVLIPSSNEKGSPVPAPNAIVRIVGSESAGQVTNQSGRVKLLVGGKEKVALQIMLPGTSCAVRFTSTAAADQELHVLFERPDDGSARCTIL